MTSAQDKAETIINDLQAFLNTQQSKDDSGTATDLDLWHSPNSSLAEGQSFSSHSGDYETIRWNSSDLDNGVMTRSTFAATSEVFMVPQSAQSVTDTKAMSLNLGDGHTEDIYATVTKVKKGSLQVQSYPGHVGNEVKVMPVLPATTPEETGPPKIVISSSNDEASRVSCLSETYNFLEPTSPPPSPREFRESTAVPFPMIFRRSMKDPGSKQYNELVKELEQVLEKRKVLQRTRSMHADLDNVDNVDEAVNNLKTKRKMSNSMDNLSVFSNKALLNRLENHFKNRTNFASLIQATNFNTSRDPGEKKDDFSSGHKATLMTVTSSHPQPREAHGDIYDSLRPKFTNVTVTSVKEVEHEEKPPLVTLMPEKTGAVSVIKVNSGTLPLSSRNLDSDVTGSLLSVNTSPQRIKEQDSSAHEMSFSSEENIPALNASSTVPRTGHYKKHHEFNGHQHFSNHLHQHSYLYQSATNPEVMYRSHTLDPHHITRISVSKSADSIPLAVMAFESESHGQKYASSKTLDRHRSAPMKTIAEHLGEADMDDISLWSSTGKSSKKHKERGVHRSISQRMVEKVIRVIRPKSSPSNPVSRSSSFSQSSAQNSGKESKTQSGGSWRKKFLSRKSKNTDISKLDRSEVEAVSSPSNLSLVQSGISLDLQNSYQQQGTIERDGKVVVPLPNNHKASIVPTGLQTSSVHSGLHVLPNSELSESVSAAARMSRAAQVDSGPSHWVENSVLTVELPNHHKAAIIPSLQMMGGTPTVSTGLLPSAHNDFVGRQASVARSSSFTTSTLYRQTYRPVQDPGRKLLCELV